MKPLILISLFISSISWATTQRYRLMFNDDPSTTVTIGWEQVSGSSITVHYGTTDFGTNWASYPNSIAPYKTNSYMGMTNKFTKITGLLPNTAYYFVIKDSDGTSSRYWFKTCPNVNTEKLSFISGGDSRSGQTQRQNSNKMVAKIRPHAVLFGGDLVNTPGNSSVQTWLDDWQFATTSDDQMIPLVHSFGNHEDYGSGGAYFLRDLFDVTDDAYYHVVFGGDLFSMYTLNGEVLPGHTIANSGVRAAQTSWLSSSLTADNAIWKAAQYHRPIVPHYSGKGEGADEFNDWAQLFYDNGVRVVMESDAHVVKLTEEVKPVNSTASGNSSNWFTSTGIAPDQGITFIGEGSWGTIRTPDDAHPMTVGMGSFYSFSWLTVDQCKIEIRTIDTQSPNSIPEHTPTDLFSISSALDAVIWKPSGQPSGVTTITKCYAPNADFSANQTSVFTGVSINFTDLSTNTPTSWLWNFGDGNTSTSQNPSHSYTTAGSYTVTLSATNADGTGVETKTAYIIVSDPVAPNAEFTVDDQTPSVSQTIQFTDLSVDNPASWSWNFGDGNTSINQNPTHSYVTPGVYNVTLAATNIYGSDTENKIGYITVSSGGTVTVSVASGSDDAEEETTGSPGSMYLTSSDLEIGNDGGTEQLVGMRFLNINVPQGATISNSKLRFRADENDFGGMDAYIAGQNADNTATFTSNNNNISNRPVTAAMVTWNNLPSFINPNIYDSPDISAIVQEIVDRPGWASGSSMVYIIWSDPGETSERIADSYEGNYPVELIFDWTMPLPPAPLAGFNASNTTICLGDNVNFSDVSTNNPTSWMWDFGDGNNSTSQNPSYNYTTPGTYTVVLTASNSGGSDVLTQTNYITVNPNPTISAGPNQTICFGDNATIAATGANSYTWDNGLGAGPTHTVSPNATTSYIVTGSAAGCSAQSTVTINVNPLPNVSAGTNSSICQGNTAVISASGAMNYTWDNSLGAGSSHTVSPSTSTTYAVTGTDANNCVNTDAITITVDTPNNPGIATPISACFSDNSVLLDNGLTGADAGGAWSDDDATGAVSGNLLDATGLTVGNTYNFTYTLAANGTCPSAQQTTQVTITGTVDAGTPSSNLTACTDDANFDLFVTLTGFTSGGSWTDDDATGALTGSNINCTGLSAGSYDFTYNISGGACGNDSETINLTIEDVPNLTVSNDSSICEGNSIDLSVSGANIYAWDNGLGAGANHTVSPSSTITYVVTGTNTLCSAQSSITVTVNPNPIVTLNAFDPDTICSGQGNIALPSANPTGGTFNGTGVSGNQFDSDAAGLGNHMVFYTYSDVNNCSSEASTSITVTECLSIQDGGKDIFNIYPNPANDYIIIERANVSDFEFIKIYDMNGKLVFNEQAFNNPLKIVTSEWERGTYTLHFSDKSNKLIQRKFILN